MTTEEPMQLITKNVEESKNSVNEFEIPPLNNDIDPNENDYEPQLDQDDALQHSQSLSNPQNSDAHDNNNNDRDIPIKIRKKLLTTEEHKSYSKPIDKTAYQRSSETSFLESSPPIVKISGFELNKKTTVKINIINKSQYGQRVQIISPKTSIFKLKYTKRAQIPPGLSEVLYLSFFPQQYQYYNESIYVRSANCQLVIPIHAYPKMNVHCKCYIPKLIDMGDVALNTTFKKEISINNIIDIPFNYEIRSVKGNDDIVIKPMTGEFPAMESKKLVIQFHPKRYGQFNAEYEFRMSEIEFVPYVFRVYGVCHNFKDNRKRGFYATSDIERPEIAYDEGEAEGEGVNGDNTATAVGKSSNIEEEKNSEIEISEQQQQQQQQHSQYNNNDNNQHKRSTSTSVVESRPQSKMLSKFKDFPSNKEREFLNYYNTAEHTIQDKEFKYIRFIGKEPLTAEQTQNIINERNEDKNAKINTKCQLDKDTHKPELDKELPEIDRDIQFYIKPNFNLNHNAENQLKKRHYFNLFLKGITKVIINRRADKNLKKLQQMISTHNIKTRDDFATYCDKDWIDYFSRDQLGENTTDDDGSNENAQFNFMKMKFIPLSTTSTTASSSSSSAQLLRETVYLTNEYNLNSFKQEIPHTNNINLDEYPTFDKLERSDLEVIGYKPFVSPGLTQFDINTGTGEKTQRPSCETESTIRGERGDSEIAFEKIEELFELPSIFQEHIYTEPHDLAFTNSSLKKYVSISQPSETDVNYHIRPHIIENNFYTPLSSYQNDMYMKINFSYSDTGKDNIKLQQIDKEHLLIDQSFDYDYDAVTKMQSADIKDVNFYRKQQQQLKEQMQKNESEQTQTQQTTLMPMSVYNRDDDKALLDMIEKDGDVIGKVREENKVEVMDEKKKEKINLHNKFEGHKKKWYSTMPTVIDYFNSGIVNPDNKFSFN